MLWIFQFEEFVVGKKHYWYSMKFGRTYNSVRWAWHIWPYCPCETWALLYWIREATNHPSWSQWTFVTDLLAYFVVLLELKNMVIHIIISRIWFLMNLLARPKFHPWCARQVLVVASCHKEIYLKESEWYYCIPTQYHWYFSHSFGWSWT